MESLVSVEWTFCIEAYWTTLFFNTHTYTKYSYFSEDKNSLNPLRNRCCGVLGLVSMNKNPCGCEVANWYIARNCSLGIIFAKCSQIWFNCFSSDVRKTMYIVQCNRIGRGNPWKVWTKNIILRGMCLCLIVIWTMRSSRLLVNTSLPCTSSMMSIRRSLGFGTISGVAYCCCCSMFSSRSVKI